MAVVLQRRLGDRQDTSDPRVALQGTEKPPRGGVPFCCRNFSVLEPTALTANGSEGPAPAPRWAGAPRASRSPLALPTRPTLHPQENDTICLGCLLRSLRLGAGGVLLSACVVAGSEPRGSSLLHPRSAGTVPEPKPAPSRWHSRLVATAHVPAWKQRENQGDCRVPGLRDRCPSQRCVQGTPVTGWESPGAQGSAWDCPDSRVHAPAAAVAPMIPVQETP